MLPVAAMVRVLVVVIALGLGLSIAAGAVAQQSPAPSGEPPRAEAATPPPALTPIEVASIPQRARETEAQLGELRGGLADSELDRVEQGLPALLEDMANADSFDQASLLRRRQQRDVSLDWRTFAERVAAWQRILAQHTDALERNTRLFRGLERTWGATQAALKVQPETPPAAFARTDAIVLRIREAQGLLRQRGQRLFELRERLDAAQQSVDLKVMMVRRAEQRMLDQLTRPDGLALWQLVGGGSLPRLTVKSAHMARAGRAFWDRYGRRLPLDAIFALLFLAGWLLFAGRARRRVQTGAALPSVFEAPFLSGLLLTLILVRLVYHNAMSPLIDALGIVSLSVLAALTPLLVPRPSVRPLTWTVIALLTVYRSLGLLHVADAWRDLASLIIAVLLLGILLWAIGLDRRGLLGVRGGRLARATGLFLRAGTLCLSVAILAGTCGYNGLLAFLLEGVAFSCHWLLFLIALTRVLTAFIDAAFASARLSRLASMREHGELMRARALWLVNALGVSLWCLAALKGFEAFEPLMSWLARVLGSALQVGSWSISLGSLVAFVVAIYLTVALSRTVSFFLDVDILPRMELARGVPPAVSRLSRYAILALGFVLAVGAAGVDMSKVALLVSALSVGIGFGLQNVINNFVSGLVLIFERPVRVGDLVQVDDLIGTVQSIGIRSSTLRTAEGAEAILPNSQLIAERVINWTLSDPKRRVDIQVGVAYGTDPTRVLQLLRSATEGVPGVSPFPEPTCLFLRFGDSSLDFELRAWALRSEDWVLVRSALAVALHDKLAEAGIAIPFPQQDLHLRSVDGAVARLLGPGLEAVDAPAEKVAQ